MNKQIKIDKNMKIIFIIDIVVFISMIIFKFVYSKIGYYYPLINFSFIFNIIFFSFCLFYTFYLVIGKKKIRYCTFIIFSLFIIYILFNTIGIIIINKPIEEQYKKVSKKIISYCDKYSCDTYETKYIKDNRKLIIQKTYFDYDNNQNNIIFETLYNKDKIIETKAIVESSSDLFSEEIINDEVKNYFFLFNKEIDKELILNAFNNRFNDGIKKDNITYEVKEVYDEEKLIKLKTIITLKID